MSSKLIVNIDELQEDIVVPNTGVFGIDNTNSTSNNVFPIIGVATTMLIIFVIVVAILLRVRNKKKISFRKHSKSFNNEFRLKRNFAPRIAGFVVLMLAFTFMALNYNNSQESVNAFVFGDEFDGMTTETLSITVEDVIIDLEMGSESVFGLGSSEITIDSATQAGYTLMAYVEGETTSLARRNDKDGLGIEMLEATSSQALGNNTWGVALEAPGSQTAPVFRGLPNSREDALVVNVSGGHSTRAGDKTTLYYGVYVTPDLPYGTYEGAVVNYVAVAHAIPDDDDVTVKYHGNGFYFDEQKTKSTNTVVYGGTCELAYIGVGGGCTTVYVGEEDAKVSKTPKINDDGVAEIGFGYNSDSVYVDSVSFEGADLLKVELTYGVEDWYDFLYIFEGVHDETDYWFVNEDKVAIVNDGSIDDGTGTGVATFYVDSDAVTFVLTSDYSYTYYGYYAVVMPVYFEQPNGIETVEDQYCQLIKSDNIDNDGEIIESYSSDYYTLQTVSIPGASKIKVELEYAITANSAWIAIVEGVFAGDWDDEPRGFAPYEIYSENNNISGTEEFVIDGSIITFEMELWNEPTEGYDYGFYAKLYPIYDEEHEGTTTTQMCSYGVKEGEYLLPLANSWYEEWYFEYVDSETGDNRHEYFEEAYEIIDFVYAHPDLFPNNVIDVYAEAYYRVVYDGNGGVPYDEEEDTEGFWIWEDDSKMVWENWFKKEGYDFIGWNTKPDGSGDWYYPGDYIYSEGHIGETLTLYAQWRVNVSQ